MKKSKQLQFKVKCCKKIALLLFALVAVHMGIYGSNPSWQQQEITGKVVNVSGDPVTGVTVIVKGTYQGTITDSEGEFSLDVSPGDEVLVFSFVGMKTQEIPIEDRTYIEIVMEEDVMRLEEVVAIGYMTQRKADLTGSIAVVDRKDLERVSSPNVMKSLQGKIPGVFVTTDGNPAENVNIEIRGLTSTTASPPLLVIDGLPTQANLREINALDIESMQFLKDAASASIYGSRAAGGVILINTKQGRPGDLEVKYDGSYGMNTYMGWQRPDLMNTAQYGQTIWQASVNDGLDPNEQTMLYDYDWNMVDGVPTLNGISTVEWLNSAQTLKASDTDWFDLLTENGKRQNHQLSVSSGTERARQMFSLNYFENNGAQINTYLKRYSARINTSYDLIDGRLKIGENLLVSSTNYNGQNGIYRALVMPSIAPEYATDGVSWGGSALESGMDEHRHPTKDQKLHKDNDNNRFKAIGSVFANLSLFRGFSLNSQYGLEYSTLDYRHIDFTWEEVGGQGDALNGVTSYHNKSAAWTWTNTANYTFSNTVHNLNAVAGIEAFRYTDEYFSTTREQIELENYDYAHISAGTGNITASGFGGEHTLLSYFSKVNYSLLNKYLFAFTARYDGSSKFPTANKFGFFPAASIGWRISSEPFMQSLTFISDLKVRASWGMNGNSNIPSNAINDVYDANYAATAYMIDGRKEGLMPSGYRLTHSGNPNIRWEATEQYNLGLDFGLFGHRLAGAFDVYRKITDGMLYELQYVGTTGEGSDIWINAANMTNDGVELGITFRSPLNSRFSYSITGNMAANNNRIDDLPEFVVYSYGGNGLGDNILGRPLRSTYGFVADGIYQTQQEVDEGPEQNNKRVGGIRFKDLDGDGRITEAYDRTWIAVREPDLTVGLNAFFEYGGFDVNFFVQGVLGNQIYNDYKLLSDFYNTGVIAGRNHTTRLLDAWSPYNTSSTIPALSTYNVNEETRMSTYFIESGSYVKLRTLEIGYTMPGSVSNRLFLNRLRVYFMAENTLMISKRWGDNAFTGVDPEAAGNFANTYDRPATISFGVNATF